MQYCVKCTYPETKPDLTLDENGVCDACRNSGTKKEVDWEGRRKELVDLIERYKSKDGSNYDCVIAVSGGKDSFYQTYIIKKVLGYNPLLVTWSACEYTELGLKNIKAMQNLGADHIQFTPNPVVYKKLFKEGFVRLGDGCWPCHVGIFTYPIQIAVKFKIPLIIYGENAQLEQGGPPDAAKKATIDRRWLEEFGGLLGCRVKDMVGNGITMNDLQPYVYPSDEELKAVGITGLYLGYFFNWDARKQVDIIKDYGFKVNEEGVQEGTYVNYENLDGKFVGVHDYLKFLKYGFGRASDHASLDIRNKRISREEGIQLALKYEGKIPTKYLSEYLKFVNMTEEEFHQVLLKFTNKSIFVTDANGNLVKDAHGNLIKRVYDNDGQALDAEKAQKALREAEERLKIKPSPQDAASKYSPGSQGKLISIADNHH